MLTAMMRAREIMQPAPVTVSSDTPISEVLKLLYANDLRHLPVVEQDRLIGIISDRDVREVATPALLPSESNELLALPTRNLMAANPLTVDSEANVTQVIDQLITGRIGAVPVVAPGSQDLVGIISYVDVLRAARPLFDRE
jgi:acetoin utilization protein AcuB